MQRGRDAIQIQIKADVDRASFAKARAEGGTLGGSEEVTLKADIDRTSFSRVRAAEAVLTKESGKLSDVFSRSNLSIGQWTGILASALPVIVDLGGALGALTASAGAATAGLGALAVGGAGAGGVGLAGIAAIATPAIAKLKDLKTAQDAYTLAVQQYGRHSTQARTAFSKLATEQKRAGPAASKFAGNLAQVQRQFQRLTQPGQQSFFGLLNDGLDRLNQKLPLLAKSANSSMAALRVGFDQFLKKATGPEFDKFINVMTRTFANSAKPLGDAFGNIAKILERIAVAVAPDVVRVIKQLDSITQDWVDSTSNASDLRDTVHSLVNQTEAWGKLLGAATKLIFAALIPGMGQGKQAVEGITQQLQEWTRWVNAHPREMRDFFKQGLETTKQLVQVLLGFLPTLFQISTAMRPIARAFLGLLRGLNSLKIGNISALTVFLGLLVSAKIVRGVLGLVGTFKALKVAIIGVRDALLGVQVAEEAVAATQVASPLAGTAAAQASRALPFAGVGGVPRLGVSGAEAAAAAFPFAGMGAEFQGAAKTAAGSWAGFFAKALPFAIAAAGIGNIISSAVQGDTTGTIAKTGGALAGALVGGLVGGLPGALVGAGIGSLLGGVVAKAFAGAPDEAAKRVRIGFKDEQRSIQGLVSSLRELHRARQRQHDTTKAVQRAERQLAEARKRYPAQSRPVLEAERKLRQAKDADRRATQRLKDADKLHGIQREATKRIIAASIQTELRQIGTTKRQRQVILDNFRADVKNHASLKQLKYDQDQLNDNTKKLNVQQGRLAKIQNDAATKIGPKWAKTISDQTDKTKHLNVMLDRMTGATNKQDGAEDKLRRSTDDLNKKGSKDFQNFRDAGVDGLRQISDAGNKVLRSLGVQKAKFMASPAAHPAQGGTRNFQTGGMLVPGTGSGDKVPVRAMVEPGEVLAVLNRNAAKAWMAWNEKFPRFQGGGFAGMQPGIVRLARLMLQKFGGSMSSGFRPGDPGFHGRGLAADIVPANWSGATRYANQIGPQLLEGIHQGPPGQNVSWDSGHKVSPSFWGAATWAQHVSHIHMAISGAAKGLGAAVEKLKRIILKGPKGALKDLGQAALDKTWKAANAYLAKQAPAMSTDVAVGKGVLSRGEMRKLMKAHKMPDIMGWIAAAESGFNPAAFNRSGASGLWQIMMPLHRDIVHGNVFDPNVNADAAMTLFRQSGLSPWAASQAGWGSHVGQPFRKGGVIGPYIGKFHDGGPVLKTGLGLLHQGEEVIPHMQKGGTLSRLQERAQEVRQRAREVEKRLEKEQASAHPDKGLIKHLQKLEKRLQSHEEKVSELISEQRQIHSDSKERNRLLRAIQQNERGGMRAVSDYIASDIGYRQRQKTRQAAAGSVARY